MKSLNFEGADLKIGGKQNEYTTLHAKLIPGKHGEVLMIFELTDEEVAEIVRTRCLVYNRWTFGAPFQPMRIMVQWPLDVAPVILPDTNGDPKLN